jgi:hypothetical protein
MEDTLVKQETDSAAPPKFELRIADRCDGCSAQAFMVARKDIEGKTMELLFCGHHGREAEPQLIAQGFEVQDETNRINSKPTNPEDFDV